MKTCLICDRDCPTSDSLPGIPIHKSHLPEEVRCGWCGESCPRDEAHYSDLFSIYPAIHHECKREFWMYMGGVLSPPDSPTPLIQWIEDSDGEESSPTWDMVEYLKWYRSGRMEHPKPTWTQVLISFLI